MENYGIMLKKINKIIYRKKDKYLQYYNLVESGRVKYLEKVIILTKQICKLELIIKEKIYKYYPKNFELLTKQELKVLKLIKQNYNNKAIAKKLWISPNTAKKHKTNIGKKLKKKG